MRFDWIAVLDWSAARGPKRGRDAIWLAVRSAGVTEAKNIPTRPQAEAALAALLSRPGRGLLGVDFALGFPKGFAEALTGAAKALAVWSWLAERVREREDHTSTFRAAAAEANACFPGAGPFWGQAGPTPVPGIPAQKPPLPPGLSEFRSTERAARALGLSPKSVWQLAGAGVVGAQTLSGLPVLARLRSARQDIAAWPLEPWAEARIVFAEVYPSLVAGAVIPRGLAAEAVRDEAQVRALAEWLWQLNERGVLQAFFAGALEPEEGWILGIPRTEAAKALLAPVLTKRSRQQARASGGAAENPMPANSEPFDPTQKSVADVRRKAPLVPPRLSNDCFALPQGVNWVPVDEALARLRAGLSPVAEVETLPVSQAGGRVLAAALKALRPHPPAANAAVDGYGFAHAALSGEGPWELPLLPGRAAAGAPYPSPVQLGSAVRVLTGALLPAGVDTVVLEEDVATDGQRIAFSGPIKLRANTRPMGEDVAAGQEILPAGRRLTPADLALISAVGVREVAVFRLLRVAVLSTGDEIAAEPDPSLPPDRTIDANRPMLIELIRRWGFVPVDLGHALDRAEAVRKALDRGASEADAILTSGGASAGDEDHLSRLLRAEGTLTAWRVAIKPGRPLALGLWRGVPLFGLPGNPVAAFVCALLFARPALWRLAGAAWPEPLGFVVPAAFSKRKKAGRREYLRARLTAEGTAEVFRSEGSGRISGLSWAEGLVELPDGAVEITPGSPVRYLPFAGFGI